MLSSSKLSCRLHILIALMMALCFAHAAVGQTLVVRTDVHHDVSPPLRDLIKQAQPAEQEQREAEEVKLIPLPPGFKPADVPDPVLQPPFSVNNSAPTSSLAPVMGLNFDGIGQGVGGFIVNLAPPDTEGAVGATQYVQWVNVNFAIYNKTTGALISGPTPGKTLWAGFGGGCE